MNNSLDSLFRDCHRRAAIQVQKEGAADLARLWAGLGFPSQFKGKARAFFEPIGAETPRVLCWYRLTEAGRAEYLARYEGKPGFFD
jgi:hypothetical protein